MTQEVKQTLLKRSGNKCEACGTPNDIGPGGKPSGSRLYVVEAIEDPRVCASGFDVLCARCRGVARRYQPIADTAGQLELFEG